MLRVSGVTKNAVIPLDLLKIKDTRIQKDVLFPLLTVRVNLLLTQSTFTCLIAKITIISKSRE